MFSRVLQSIGKLINKIRTHINLRLAALFSAMYIVSLILLFTFTYLMIGSVLKREDHDVMRFKLLELWTSYHSGGIESVQRQISVEKVLGERKFSFIRVADGRGNDLFLIFPESWQQLSDAQLDWIFTHPEEDIIRIQIHGNRYLLETRSLRLEDGNILQIGMNVTDRFSVLEHFKNVFVLIAIPIVFIGFVGGALLADRSLRPIRRISRAVRTIVDTGRIGERVTQKRGGSELDDLVQLFNRMLGRIEVLVRGMQSALDSVAHDLRTPLTRLRGTAEEALGSSDEAALRRALVSSVEESENILTMLNTLMDISEAETGVMKLEYVKIDLRALVTGVTDLYRYVAEEGGISLSASVPDRIAVRGDLGRIRQAVANLLDNAVKYTPRGGSVSVEAGETGDGVFVSVRDTGVGIPGDEIPRIWDRLYRGVGARDRSGLGLGLSLVRAVIEAHGGEVRVQSRPQEGSDFTVVLPHRRPGREDLN
jgi:signal transduction histidine kinase